ncbi:MAG: MlaD family protein [Bryobacteraceae bacterium]|jgi:phospholipid/cholesterol/gamma-HCH transport system substrate-binding protein
MPSARQVRWAKFRVLTVSVAAVIILSILAYLLTGGSLLLERAPVYLYLPDATGLGPGAPVRVDGIGVGKVRSVTLSGSSEPNRVVKVTMAVERGRLASIPDDSTAQVASETVVGDKFVDVSSGTSAHYVSPGGEIAFKGSPELLKTLDLGQFQQRLKVVSALLDDIEQGRSDLGQFVQGEQMYDDLRKRFAQIQSGIRAAASTTSDVGRELHTDRLYRQISQPLLDLDGSLARLQSGQGAAGQLLRDSAQYEKLRSDAEDLRHSIADLRASEFLQSDSLYAGWNRRVSSLIESVDALNRSPAMTTSQAYDNLNGVARELQDTVRDFRQNPRKFMRLKVF